MATLTADLRGDELRLAIHQHLRTHPSLSGLEVARALQLPNPDSLGVGRVNRMLAAMEEDGEAIRQEVARPDGSGRRRIQWIAS